MAVYLIDTVILIDHLNGLQVAHSWLSNLGEKEAALSVITRAELLVGTTESDLDTVTAWLDCYPCYPITSEIADLAARLRREFQWKLPDAFQAALARYHKLRLVTRNTRDFNPDRFDFVLVPYQF